MRVTSLASSPRERGVVSYGEVSACTGSKLRWLGCEPLYIPGEHAIPKGVKTCLRKHTLQDDDYVVVLPCTRGKLRPYVYGKVAI
jgi:hypothetical protein